MPARRFPVIATFAMLSLAALSALTACGGSPAPGAGDGAGAGTGPGGGVISVVASTNVWGAVAAQVGGERVEVTSVLSDPSQDPHSYEATTRNRLAISKAAIVVENGGGYDTFMRTLLEAADNPDILVVNAVTVSGKSEAGGELNEHLWYDLPTVGKVANEIARTLGSVDQKNAEQYRKNAAAFAGSLTPVTARLAEIRTKHRGSPVAVTEPVPGYLLQAAGLVDRTPPQFARAVEGGGDVAPAVLRETVALLTARRVDVLVYNEQTTGPTTEAVRKAAVAAQVPVVPVTETLPAGRTFAQWMQSNADAIGAALDQPKP